MAVSPGKNLGPYEILAPIGVGGMGEVYKARDTRLDRTVAIKVLPSHLADKPQLRERFEREARTISSLNHPHICTLYDIGQQDGIHFLVMEYLEGETLADRLDKGPLPLDQVLRYAIEIADALDKAHRQGVTHRDLKPGNIMLTKSGSKLLDFGLAKLTKESAPAAPFSQLPTAEDSLTVEGTILGTLHYMAPEQVEGKVDEVDARTDIFAFGTVLYEMATGKKAFEGKNAASVMAKILEIDPPPMSSLQPMTPPALDRAVKRCLAKEPEKRWQTARDLCEELKWIAEGDSEAGVATSAAAIPARTGWRRALPLVLTAVVAVIIASITVWNLKPSDPRLITRLALTLPPGEALTNLNHAAVAISPDGTRLVYAANQQLYLRPMDSLEASPISGTEGGDGPFFSPDGQWVGFWDRGTLKKVFINGGSPLTLCDVPDTPHGTSWMTGDTIIFGRGLEGIWQVSAAGGTAQLITTAEGRTERWPTLLPDGKAVLFTSVVLGGGRDGAQIVVQDLETGERRVLIEGGTDARYAPTGHLVYVRQGTLLAVPFDLVRLEVSGSPVPIVEGVAETPEGAGQYSFSSLGRLVYAPGGVVGTERTLVWVDRQGAVEPLAVPPRTYGYPRLSPVGRQLAVGSGGDIWVCDLERQTLSRLTFDSGQDETPVWTPDGMWVTFAGTRDKVMTLLRRLADGSGEEEVLVTLQEHAHATSWSPDGQVLTFGMGPSSTASEGIWLLPLEGDRKPILLLKTPFNVYASRLSPDGRWIAYASDRSGRSEIYVQPFPGLGGKWQISTDGGGHAVWARNGRELFYRNGDKMMVVEVTTQPNGPCVVALIWQRPGRSVQSPRRCR